MGGLGSVGSTDGGEFPQARSRRPCLLPLLAHASGNKSLTRRATSHTNSPMRRIFSTAGLHPRDRFACWHEVACKNIVGHNSSPETRSTFQAEMSAGSVADVELLWFRNSAMDAERTREHIARAESDAFFVCLQQSKELFIEQAGHQARLRPRDFCLVDPLMPYTAKFHEGSELLVLKVARQALEARVGKGQPLTAQSLAHRSAIGEFTSGYLGNMQDFASKATCVEGQFVSAQILDLIALSIAGAEGGAGVTLSSPRAYALQRLRTAVDCRLTDPVLTPASVAAAAGISVRYANALLAQQGTSLARFIRSLRLERCRQALEDMSQSHRTISEIAFGWGFSDQSHFSRAFSKAFGVSPREYRSSREGLTSSPRPRSAPARLKV